jgi:chromosomal replication initiator protein
VVQDDVWQAVLGEMEVSLSVANYKTWFTNTSLVKAEDGVVVIGVYNIFMKEQLEKKFNDLIASTLKKQGVKVTKVEYKIVPAQAPKHSSQPLTLNSADTQTLAANDRNLNRSGANFKQSLNERYTFDNFVVGAGSELAFAACQAVAQTPGTKYNPLYLYGGVGIGKTHLIQAVGTALQKRNPDAKILYIATEQFVREFVQALTGSYCSNIR